LALRLAEEHPAQRFLVFSTDPAHSLSDSFAEPIGRFRRGVAATPNLDGVEINAIEMFEEFKSRYRTWIEEIFDSLTAGSNWQVEFDREAMQELIALAPPGIDEIAALSAVSDFLENQTYTAIVLDTAPTGHLLRFLELPQVALEWVRALMKLLLKYRQIVTSSSAAEELVAFSKRIKRIMAILKDVESCDFTAVTIAERMSLAETTDLVRGVHDAGISVGRVLINNLVPDGAAQHCNFCAERRRHQIVNVDRVRTEFAGRTSLLLAEQLPEPVTGPASLRRFVGGWPEAVREARGSA
jgi:arsenite/tail-anchored protein-transporting ATPase